MARRAKSENSQTVPANGASSVHHGEAELRFNFAPVYKSYESACGCCGFYHTVRAICAEVTAPDDITRYICPVCCSLPPSITAQRVRECARRQRKDADKLDALAQRLERLQEFPDVQGLPVFRHLAALSLEGDEGLAHERKCALREFQEAADEEERSG